MNKNKNLRGSPTKEKPTLITSGLKLFNGRGHGYKYDKYHLYVAAKSMKQAAELVSAACFNGRKDLVPVSEIKVYYNKNAWGNRMIGVVPTEPCVYAHQANDYMSTPLRIL